MSTKYVKSVLVLAIFLAPYYGCAQGFHLKYWFMGLGINASYNYAEDQRDCASRLEIEIHDTVLTYSICESHKRQMQRNFYTMKFRQSSIDSIKSYLDTLKGKHIYAYNHGVRSGGVYNYFIKCDELCSHFEMTNTYDSTALKITNLINSYLTNVYHIPIPDELWVEEQNWKLIEDCSSEIPYRFGDIFIESETD